MAIYTYKDALKKAGATADQVTSLGVTGVASAEEPNTGWEGMGMDEKVVATAKEVPGQAYNMLVKPAIRFAKSAAESPKDIVDQLQGKPITSSPTKGFMGEELNTFQSEFQDKTIPQVLSGERTPLNATLGTTGAVVEGAAATLGLAAGAQSLTKVPGAVKTLSQQVSNTAQTGINSTKQTATSLSNVGGNMLKGKEAKALSIFTGEKNAVVQSALKNPAVADIGIKGGDDALRTAVQQGGLASIKSRTTFMDAYNTAFGKLASLNPGKLASRQKILYQFVDDMEAAGIKVKDGVPDFTTSLIKANPGEATKIRDTYEAIMKWDDWSLVGVNKLKQLTGRLTKFATEQGGSSKSPFLGRFYNFLDNEIKGNLPKNAAKEYARMNKKFTDNIDLYDDMVDAFNSGDPFKRIAQLFSDNADSLRQIVSFYEKQTGNQISPIVAGRELAELKQAPFGLLNPRSWIDFFLDPSTQAQIVTKTGRAFGNK